LLAFSFHPVELMARLVAGHQRIAQMSAESTPVLPNERAQYLLNLLIQRFIRDGQPVGSRTLSRDSGLDLSPATIRNVMSDLEHLGLISAPHTSAGRIPTSQGYRFFVDTLVRYKAPEDGEISQLRSEISEQPDDPDAFMGSVSKMLSAITSMAGVVTVPRGQQAVLRQIEFLALADHRVLVILVINDREVQNRILHTEHNYGAAELQRAANFINENYVGTDLVEVRKRLIEELDSTRNTMNQAMHDIISVAQSALAGASAVEGEFVIRGETKLMDFAELSDIETIRRLFDAFSRKRFMLDLLDRSINADGVQVFIGDESGYGLLDDVSVITAPYKVDANHVGVLGVIGPTRMAYDRVVPIVDITARLLSSAFGNDDS
jgi:heat-inducible transcriptional repressor